MIKEKIYVFELVDSYGIKKSNYTTFAYFLGKAEEYAAQELVNRYGSRSGSEYTLKKVTQKC